MIHKHGLVVRSSSSVDWTFEKEILEFLSISNPKLGTVKLVESFEHFPSCKLSSALNSDWSHVNCLILIYLLHTRFAFYPMSNLLKSKCIFWQWFAKRSPPQRLCYAPDYPFSVGTFFVLEFEFILGEGICKLHPFLKNVFEVWVDVKPKLQTSKK